MEIKRFTTVIPAGHKHSENQYVHGVVMGIIYALCEEPNNTRTGSFHTVTDDRDKFNKLEIITRCTTEQYLKMVSAVEKLYPGLCAFDGKIDYLRKELTS